MKNFLHKCIQVQEVSLHGCNYAFAAALSTLSQATNLSKLSLRDCLAFNDAALSSLVMKFPSLKVVDLVRTSVTSAGLVSFLAVTPDLKGLCISVAPTSELIDMLQVRQNAGLLYVFKILFRGKRRL